jgi:hypothetical protein
VQLPGGCEITGSLIVNATNAPLRSGEPDVCAAAVFIFCRQY